MTLYEIWNVSPQSHVFAVCRRGKPMEYKGENIGKALYVSAIKATEYPMFRSVIEVKAELSRSDLEDIMGENFARMGAECALERNAECVCKLRDHAFLTDDEYYELRQLNRTAYSELPLDA